MKNLVLLLATACVLFTSCSIEPVETVSFEGTWKLTEWSVNIPIDLNNDVIESTNLLDEIDCESHETLVFDSQGTVISNFTFNPKVDIALVDASTNNYEVLVECDTEGVISTATTYVRDKNVLIIDDRMATFKNDKLVIVFKDAQKIYNQDFTSVIGTKNLKLVYTKL